MATKRKSVPRAIARTPTTWTCPKCARVFRQQNQAHSCGVGSRRELLTGKTPALAALYASLEKELRRWPGLEIVMRGRYVLLRTTRIFADLVFMKEALRLMILLDAESKDARFIKVGRMSSHRVAHVTLGRTATQLRGALRYLKRAYRFSLEDR
jgi:hypothetical protein